VTAGDGIRLGERAVGHSSPVFVIAEAGVNHDGDPDTALELVDAAAAAGADAVKFQTFEPTQLVTAGSELAAYQRERESGASTQLEMLSRLTLDRAAHERLVARCAQHGISFLSTPFDSGSASLLADLGVPAFKVGSGELTNLPFLEQLAAYRRPILLSTGMSDLDEVSAAVAVIRRHGAPLVLLHCVSSYPAPDAEANLRAIGTLRRTFEEPVGYSDHCLGMEVSLAAVAAGACMLERHFTLDRSRPGPDHAMSMEPEELGELIRRVRSLETILGDGVKRPQPSEAELRVVARRSIVAARPLAAGERLSADALAIKRPGDGLPPARLPDLVGRRVLRDVEADDPLREEDLE
jgi:N,N'-diacetyllegionaminate synthase